MLGILIQMRFTAVITSCIFNTDLQRELLELLKCCRSSKDRWDLACILLEEVKSHCAGSILCQEKKEVPVLGSSAYEMSISLRRWPV